MAEDNGGIDAGAGAQPAPEQTPAHPGGTQPTGQDNSGTLMGQPGQDNPGAKQNPQPADSDWSFDAADFKDSGISAPFIDGYQAIAKELGLSKENASALLTKAGELISRLDVQAVEKQNAEWIAAARNDKEFGGSALNANLAIAKKGLDAFGGEPLKELLETTGLGNHPEVIRFFWKVGKAVSEDTFSRGGTGSRPASEEEIAKQLYPTMQ